MMLLLVVQRRYITIIAESRRVYDACEERGALQIVHDGIWELRLQKKPKSISGISCTEKPIVLHLFTRNCRFRSTQFQAEI